MTTKNITKTQLLSEMRVAQDNLTAFVASLTDEQWALTDHAGWTTKDHLMHMANWTGSTDALLKKEPRHEAMGLPENLWFAGDYDAMNEILRQRSIDRSQDDVVNALKTTYEQLVIGLEPFTNDELQQPYITFQPHDDPERRNYPLIYMPYHIIVEHYDEHLGYIRQMITDAD